IGGEKAESIVMSLDTAKSPISIDAIIRNGRLVFVCEYRADMYSQDLIMGMADCLAVVSQEFLTKTYIKEVSMLSDRAREEVEGFNKTDYPVSFVPVHKLFEAQADNHCNETAFIADGKKLSYGELNSEANRIAHSLIEKGLTVGEPVGIILPRTTDVPTAEYGIMKAGGAFLPMLPDYPDDRIDYCLRDSESRFVITTEDIKAERVELFEGKPYTVLTVAELLENENTENPSIDVPVDSLAYVIYTSGSTGTPKGVMIEHRNLCNFVDANPLNYETVNFVSFGKTALSVASISFDFSLMEIHIPLCNGMAVCMAGEEEIHNPLALFKLITDNNVDVMSGTPSFIASFVDLPQAAQALSGIKMYDMGAEAFPPALYKKMHKASPDAVIVNGYGPTEATISCISKVMDGSGAVTIGKPAANVRAYICDMNGNILPTGARGELVICGDGVGRGYVNLPEKTADVFITLNGRKAYRSGDLARFNKDGEIEFFGRLDNQVKLRGFRVELDEIEAVMNEFPQISRSVVLVKENPKSGQFLCGYFTASTQIDKSELTEHMKRSLTYYMIPSVLIQLDSLPITPNGKINKKALPEPEFTVEEREYTAPKNDLQKKLCDMFANALGAERVGIDENFFEIGGTSLSASKIAMRALTENLPIAYGDIFDNPTVEMLERHILKQQGKSVTAQEKQEEVVLEGVDKALQYNTAQFVDEVEYTDIGDVLLTGATGFLGIHILNEIIKHTQSRVYCLVRKGKASSVESRLKNMLVYYFGDAMDNLFCDRIIPVEGDITNDEIISSLDKFDFKTVINCAASVKHFTNDDTLERINVKGVENLIAFCVKAGRRLVQVSTTSVAGVNVNRKFPPEKKIHENELYFGQDLSNKYVDTKFRAEKAVLEAVANDGLDGKIVRVGNLMSRHSDGEFQVNANTNGFMRFLRAYAAIGKFPVSGMDEAVEFSPIDYTAAAVMYLAGTNSKFTVFQACNAHSIEMGDVVELLNKCGIKIDVVKDKDFTESLNESLKDDRKNMLISGLISYATSDNDKTEEFIGYDNSFTTKALYRLGFKWPIINEKYLENALNALATLGFFDGRVD
ncbi:MAG: amino acid adenylation domain-containing protein, partial [Acutalibacteraceae bacterium]